LRQAGYDLVPNIIGQRSAIGHLIGGQYALQLRHLRAVALLLCCLRLRLRHWLALQHLRRPHLRSHIPTSADWRDLAGTKQKGHHSS
jgi:hypothetical protein